VQMNRASPHIEVVRCDPFVCTGWVHHRRNLLEWSRKNSRTASASPSFLVCCGQPGDCSDTMYQSLVYIAPGTVAVSLSSVEVRCGARESLTQVPFSDATGRYMLEQRGDPNRTVVAWTLVALCIAASASGCAGSNQQVSPSGVVGTATPDRPVVEVEAPATAPASAPVHVPARASSSPGELGQGGDELPPRPDSLRGRSGASTRLKEEDNRELLPRSRGDHQPPVGNHTRRTDKPCGAKLRDPSTTSPKGTCKKSRELSAPSNSQSK
jgi:hypothetical protein